MFTQAGFNPRRTDTGIRARVIIDVHSRGLQWRGAHNAQLIRFQSGDLAWRIPGVAILWGNQVEIYRLIWPRFKPQINRYNLPHSRIPR